MSSFNVCTSPIEHGLTLLEAGAGTGKTYSLVRIIARHIVEQEIKIDQILTVTFTRAATAEIKSRLHDLLSEISVSLKNPDQEPGKVNDLVAHWRKEQTPEFLTQARTNISTALANFDSVAIFTIDGFFQRLLKEFAFEANTLFSVELDKDEPALIQTALRDYWRQHVYTLDAFALGVFQSQIKFEDTQRFITEALRTPDAQFDKAYDVNIQSQLDAYQNTWSDFITLLAKHKEAIEDFVRNPPAGIKKTVIPFKSSTTDGFLSEIEDMLSAPHLPRINLGKLGKIASSVLFEDSAFNKGKPNNLREHSLADIFIAIDTLAEAAPKGLKSAYLGGILRFTRKRLDQLKQEKNVQSYNDVTHTLADIFNTASPTNHSIRESIKQRFQAGLIDEFQDTSPQQCSVFLNLLHHDDRYFHIIGDPKQSIYRFRGADVFSYIQASQEANHLYELRTNYRSTPRMIHAVNEVFRSADDPFLVDKKITFSRAQWENQENQKDQKDQDKQGELFLFPTPTTPPKGAPSLHIHSLSSAIKTSPNIRKACNLSVCHEIIQLLGSPWSNIESEKEGLITPSDIAILVRTIKEGHQINDALSRLNIPVTLNTRSSLMESEETKQLFIILSSLLEPRKSDLLRTALLTPAMGSGSLIAVNNDTEFNRIIHDFAEMHTQWNQHGLMPMMLNFVQEFNVRNTLLTLSQGQRKLTNFMHLVELLDEKARKEKLTPSATAQWLEMAIQGTIRDTESETLELRIATDDAAIQVLTQHTSKGLEFPIVFAYSPCPSDLTYSTPSLSYHDPQTLALKFAAEENDDPEVTGQRKKEAYADSARLAYVSLTRAAYLCHFYISPLNDKKPEEHAVYQMLDLPNETGLIDLASQSSGCIVYDSIEPDIFDQPALTWKKSTSNPSQQTENQTLVNRDPQNIHITRNQRTTSFTGITRNAPDVVHDSDSEVATSPTVDETGFWTQLQAGASLGLVFHETLEEIDFQQTTGFAALIEEKLKKYSPWREQPKPSALTSMSEEIEISLQELLKHPLSENITLNQVALSKRLTEPAFLLSGNHFSLSSLSKILVKDPPENLPAHYIDQLKTLPPSQLEGFLTGFIDLIFEHDGRFHLLDWKTNRLPSYTPDALAESMAEHHYYLQYHLYGLALDRFLAQRLGSDYDPEKHLGQVFYVFLRGIDPATPGSGIFKDQLTTSRLESMRQLWHAKNSFRSVQTSAI